MQCIILLISSKAAGKMQKTPLLWAMALHRVSIYGRVARVEELAKWIAHLIGPLMYVTKLPYQKD
jgi:hypothetical protein